MKPSDIKKLQKYLQGARPDIKIIVKGIMCVEDALMALENGADAIYISTGGHLKAWSAPSTVNVLRNISMAVKSRKSSAEVYIDSGAKRGTDVMKMLALGADAVFFNKAVMWGLYEGSVEGCKNLFEMLNDELKLAMALTCCFKIKDITEK